MLSQVVRVSELQDVLLRVHVLQGLLQLAGQGLRGVGAAAAWVLMCSKGHGGGLSEALGLQG